MSIYVWKFNTIPDAKKVEHFIDEQMPLFAENRDHLYGGDGEPIVDLMKVEHNCGAVNLEVQLNGTVEQSGDVFCFPGYYPGDTDENGKSLFNRCDTEGYFYGRIVATILGRAQRAFKVEVAVTITRQRQREVIPRAWL